MAKLRILNIMYSVVVQRKHYNDKTRVRKLPVISFSIRHSAQAMHQNILGNKPSRAQLTGRRQMCSTNQSVHNLTDDHFLTETY